MAASAINTHSGSSPRREETFTAGTKARRETPGLLRRRCSMRRMMPSISFVTEIGVSRPSSMSPPSRNGVRKTSRTSKERPRMLMTCSRKPSRLRQLWQVHSPLRAACMPATARRALSRGTHASPFEGEIAPPSHTLLEPACHLCVLAYSRLSPFGPTSLCQSLMALTVRSMPTIVRCGSSVYICKSKHLAWEPYSS